MQDAEDTSEDVVHFGNDALDDVLDGDVAHCSSLEGLLFAHALHCVVFLARAVDADNVFVFDCPGFGYGSRLKPQGLSV